MSHLQGKLFACCSVPLAPVVFRQNTELSAMQRSLLKSGTYTQGKEAKSKSRYIVEIGGEAL